MMVAVACFCDQYEIDRQSVLTILMVILLITKLKILEWFVKIVMPNFQLIKQRISMEELGVKNIIKNIIMMKNDI